MREDSPFLLKVAEVLLKSGLQDQQELCVVVPNKRAGLFLRKHLASIIKSPVFPPEIFSIEEFIELLSGHRKADVGEQLFLLYEAYRSCEGKDAESFPDFCKWAPSLISDFNECDAYLADTKALFGNLADIRDIEQWSMGEKELTELQKNYLHFWSSIGNWFRKWKELCESKKIFGSGALSRTVSENLNELISRHKWHRIFFAGFNALTPAEEKIISQLTLSGKGVPLWDMDRYYVEDRGQEAGKFFRKYRNSFMSAHEGSSEAFSHVIDLLSTEPKSITVTGVARNVSQAKAAAMFLEKLGPEAAMSERTAVVLADEELLFPVLHAIPFEGPVNVTMGYPLRNSPVTSFIHALFSLNENAERFNIRSRTGSAKFYHQDVERVIRHPWFIRSCDSSDIPDLLSAWLRDNNVVFAAADRMQQVLSDRKKISEGLPLFFPHWKNAEDATQNFRELIRYLKARFESPEHDNDPDLEFLYKLDLILNRVITLMKSYNTLHDLQTMRTLMEQYASSGGLAFFGEPLTGLQVMGLLETRTLDFDNVIILGVNENVLPPSRSNPTFIIHELRRAFGLPTFSDRDAISAYHFYRLLQRAKNIFITYNTDTELFGNREKSRFITQLMNELTTINKNIKITECVFGSGLKNFSDTSRPIRIEKNAQVLARLNELSQRGFSPSSLNMFRTCSLRFYFQYVALLREQEEVEEKVGANTLGSLMHEALEELYTPALGLPLNETFYSQTNPKIRNAVERAFTKHFETDISSTGKNRLAKEMAVRYVEELFRLEKKELEQGVANLEGLEKELKVDFPVGKHTVTVLGKADRIESRNGRKFIIDYKTGLVDKKELEVDEMKDLLSKRELDKSFQLLAYALLYARQTGYNGPIVAGILSFRKIRNGLWKINVKKNDVLDAGLLEEFGQVLHELLADLMNEKSSFSQTDDLKICEYCAFRGICGR